MRTDNAFDQKKKIDNAVIVTGSKGPTGERFAFECV